MGIVTKRELNQQTANVLDQVSETEDVIVTERGKPRWRVSTVRDHPSVLSRLEREGRYVPPSAEPTPWPANPGRPTYTSLEAADLLEELHGEH